MKDGRRKLTDEQRAELIALAGTMSERKLALKFGVSRRLISFILHPEKKAENEARFKERGGWRQYYDATKHKLAMQKHRAKKKMEGQ